MERTLSFEDNREKYIDVQTCGCMQNTCSICCNVFEYDPCDPCYNISPFLQGPQGPPGPPGPMMRPNIACISGTITYDTSEQTTPTTLFPLTLQYLGGNCDVFVCDKVFRVQHFCRYLLVLNVSCTISTPDVVSLRVHVRDSQSNNTLVGMSQLRFDASDVLTTTGFVGLIPAINYSVNVSVVSLVPALIPSTINLTMYLIEI